MVHSQQSPVVQCDSSDLRALGTRPVLAAPWRVLFPVELLYLPGMHKGQGEFVSTCLKGSLFAFV